MTLNGVITVTLRFADFGKHVSGHFGSTVDVS